MHQEEAEKNRREGEGGDCRDAAGNSDCAELPDGSKKSRAPAKETLP